MVSSIWLRVTEGARPRRYPPTRDARIVPGLLGSGAVAVSLALAAGRLGFAGSSGFDWKRAALLIAGCDLIVAALVADAQTASSTTDTDANLASLLSGAIADGVMLFAINAVTLLVLFGNGKSIERLGYCLAVLVVVPLCVTLAWRRQRAGLPDGRQQLMAYATLASTAGLLCLTRLLTNRAGDTVSASLFLLVTLIVARVAIALSGHVMPATWPLRLPGAALAIAPVLLLVAAGPFIPDATLSTLDIVAAFATGLASFLLISAEWDRYRLPRVGAWAVDAGILALCALVVVYLGSLSVELAENQSFFLGPAMDVLHGHPMLVSTFSQYGVGIMDALAALFLVVPIGYGTFTLLLSGLTVLLFAGVYVLLRWSTESRLIAAFGLMVVVVLDVFGQIYVYVDFPSTGVLRFGLPWLVILCSLAAARTPHHKRLYEALILATVAIAAVWSGEAGIYCLGTACALVCLSATVEEASTRERLRKGGRTVALLVSVSVFSLLAFTLLTRVTTGAWADWGGYLEYIRLYTVGGLGLLPIDPWSPGLALGAMYTVSTIVIVLLALMRPALVREQDIAFRAAAGLTAFGMLAYTYFLGRSHPNNLIHVSPPAVVLLFVWLGIARLMLGNRTAVAVAFATSVFLGTMIVVSESGDIVQRYPNTALASVIRSKPLDTQLQALWRNPTAVPMTAHVVSFISLVRSFRFGHANLTILLSPLVVTESLLRLDVANAVGSSNPLQESLSAQASRRVSVAVRSLRPGGIVIINSSRGAARELTGPQRFAWAQLQKRFKLKEIAHDGSGLRAFLTTEPAVATGSTPRPRGS